MKCQWGRDKCWVCYSAEGPSDVQEAILILLPGLLAIPVLACSKDRFMELQTCASAKWLSGTHHPFGLLIGRPSRQPVCSDPQSKHSSSIPGIQHTVRKALRASTAGLTCSPAAKPPAEQGSLLLLNAVLILAPWLTLCIELLLGCGRIRIKRYRGVCSRNRAQSQPRDQSILPSERTPLLS